MLLKLIFIAFCYYLSICVFADYHGLLIRSGIIERFDHMDFDVTFKQWTQCFGKVVRVNLWTEWLLLD